MPTKLPPKIQPLKTTLGGPGLHSDLINLSSWYRYTEASTDTQVPMGNLGTDTPPLVPIPGELTRGYRYPYSGIDTWCITRGIDTLPSRYRYPNSSVGFGYRYH
ncbi:hypothetical protein GQ457_04G018170 [Hibiscus cannabinus]